MKTLKTASLMLTLVMLWAFSTGASAQVCIGGRTVAIDTLTGNWLLSVPQSTYGTDYQADITVADTIASLTIDGQAVTGSYTFDSISADSRHAICCITTAGDTLAGVLQFTYWPILQLYGTFQKSPYASGTVIYHAPDSCQADTLISRIRWAGSSTAGSDRHKHNYHLKFYNADGTKREVSFFGLRTDFHWRLDAGQIDFSRVRNRVARELWADFSTPPYYVNQTDKTVRNYVRGEFVEVFVNDKYMGIYGLNEHMDRQQLKLMPYDYETSTQHGGLWKPMSTDYYSMFRDIPTYNGNSKNLQSIYIKYPNYDDVKPANFMPIYRAMQFAASSDSVFLDSVGYYFDVPVMRDYYLLMSMLQAVDNIAKNLYWACYDVQTDTRLTMAVWDMDCTQGQYWSNQGSWYHHYSVGPEKNFQNYFANRVFYRQWQLDPSFHGLATERYWLYRNTLFHPDSIVARYADLFDQMKDCGAIEREGARWSGDSDMGGYDIDLDTELAYLTDWWTRRIAYLDSTYFEPYPKGDVNFDRSVDIDDVTCLIDYVLGNPTTQLNTYKLDVNGDQMIDIDDVTTLIDYVLGNTTPQLNIYKQDVNTDLMIDMIRQQQE